MTPPDSTIDSASKRSRKFWLLLIAAAVAILDRLTKWLVVAHVALGDAVTVIPRIFRISHVENQGAAFSLFDDSNNPHRVRWALLLFSIAAAIAVLFFIFRLGRSITPTTVGLALILGGALGNGYDRWRFGFVIDFLEVHIIHYHWPDFNVADSAIVVGGMLLLLDALRAP